MHKQTSAKFHPAAMTTSNASSYLTGSGHPTTKKTLEVWRCKKRGPKYKKVGSRVYYEQDWLDAYMAGVQVTIFDPANYMGGV